MYRVCIHTVHTHTDTHTHTYIPTHTYTHTYTCAQNPHITCHLCNKTACKFLTKMSFLTQISNYLTWKYKRKTDLSVCIRWMDLAKMASLPLEDFFVLMYSCNLGIQFLVTVFHFIGWQFGIPEWIVRLRHDATHGSLPCLDVLTTGVQWALSYLQVTEGCWKSLIKIT